MAQTALTWTNFNLRPTGDGWPHLFHGGLEVYLADRSGQLRVQGSL